MKLSNIKLIFTREVRDQMRDRRTLFIIAVLPVVLYPLLGMSLFQIAQFTQEHKARVLIVGAEKQAISPPLFRHRQFLATLFVDPRTANLIELHFAPQEPKDGSASFDAREDARAQVQLGAYDAALYFPPDFAARLEAFRKSIADRSAEPIDKTRKPKGGGQRPPAARRAALYAGVPSPEIIYSTASDKSQIACIRISEVLNRWTRRIGEENLELSGVPKTAAQPFSVGAADVASPRHREGAMWSKVLPVLLLLWALTGAFYPAIDLCAGEKERGTLETLLSSPAARSEIVLGKLATVMLFSAITAILNLVSVGLTGWTILATLPGFGLPPAAAIVALAVAMPPVCALFSALCLALAAFARSTKEGQYYLMPLLFITMPLVILPMSPGVQLTLGNSLIPVTGVVLALRCLLEGDYMPVLHFGPTVAAVTVAASLLSIRWAVEQFNSETVLFRESERLDLRLWLRHLYRDRKPTPTVSAALCCGVGILLVRFFASTWFTAPKDSSGFALANVVMQLAVIGAPALLMAFLLTSAPRQTLLLRWPAWWTVPAAALLAIALHPAAWVLKSLVERLYPMSDSMRRALEDMGFEAMFQHTNFWLLLLVIAVTPAVCEELAFRGFILSGFRHLGHKWRAIILSALLFGLTHGILQQSLSASLIGVLIGYLAVQTGSILPGMVFHLFHNGLLLVNVSVTPDWLAARGLPRSLVAPVAGGGCQFEWPVVVAGVLVGVLLLGRFSRLPCRKSAEECLTDAVGHKKLGSDTVVSVESTVVGG